MKIKLKLLAAFFVFSIFAFNASLCAAQSTTADDPQVREIESVYYKAATTGSNVALTQLKLLEHKYPQAAKDSRGSSEKLNGALSAIGLRTAGLGDIFGLQPPLGMAEEIDLITGKEAIDETLQLGSIDPSVPSWARRAPPEPKDLQRVLDLDSIEKLQVRSMPWDDLLKDRNAPEPPPIFALIPQDHFVIWFEKFSKFTELEAAIKKLASSFTHFVETKDAIAVGERIAERLGISRNRLLEPLIEEMALVSEDLDFYPETHYALLLKTKSDIFASLSQYISIGKSKVEKVGDFLVISTSQTLLDRIKLTVASPDRSLKNAKEFKYALSALEQRRDGVAYFSEPFILKLVSPQYRINAARRAEVNHKLESLQYIVYAYRVITKRWPSSFDQIADEGYIEANSVTPDYQILPGGVVANKEWGSLYSLKPLSDVEVGKVSAAEKNRYDAFRQGYQSFWREFFDPIAVSITIGDQILVNTVILPLIDNSKYRDLKKFFSGTAASLSSLYEVAYLPALALASKFNFDEAIIGLTAGPTDGAENNEAQKIQARRNKINQDLHRDLQLDQPIDVFGVVGSEILLGIGGAQSLNLQNIADLNVFLALQLKDVQRFKNNINTIYRSFFKQMRGAASGFSIFQLSSEAPLQNEYKGVKYEMIPAGFANIFLFYKDNYVYFAISQLAINNLIDSIAEKSKLSVGQQRIADYSTLNHDIMFLADFDKADKLKDSAADNFLYGWSVSGAIGQFYGYLTDINMLQQSLDGESQDVSKYFPWIPSRIGGVKVVVEQSGVMLGYENPLPLDSVKVSTGYGSYGYDVDWTKDYKPANQTEFVKLIPLDLHIKLRKTLDLIRTFSIGLQFTEYGLNTKLLFGNPIASEDDSRFGPAVSANRAKNLAFGGYRVDRASIGVISLALALIMLGLIVFLVRR